jgi:hypothetical protein
LDIVKTLQYCSTPSYVSARAVSSDFGVRLDV